MDVESKQCQPINTQKVYFSTIACHLVFHQPLQGLKGVSVCLDEILVMDSSTDEHLENVRNILNDFQEPGF